ncbi:MAG: LysM peptidoglycan-binding domain-containing protein [Chloroflexi bacterium]|nr:MAG: LysM peptidoglycan-binding domain-containing protein [Chloroflexota bacterium]
MNERFTDDAHNEKIVEKLNQVAEQTKVDPQFAAELEEQLRNKHRPKTSWLGTSFRQISPVVRWVALMVLLGLVLSLSIKTLIPAPQPAEEGTPSTQDAVETSTPAPGDINTTPGPQGESFDYGGAKLFMNAQYPDSPAQVSIYTLLDTQPATAEFAQTLAGRFGIESEVYLTEGQMPDETAFMVTDGKQQLVIYTENHYTYTSDIVEYSRNRGGFPNDNAETIIQEYVSTHGFDFDFRVEPRGWSGSYLVQQLSQDGLPIIGSSAYVALRENGEILHMDVSLIDYETVPVGSYGILTAEEALRQLIDDSAVGVISGGGSVPDPNLEPPRFWYHDYPDDQTVTVYGEIASHKAVDTGVPAILLIDNVPLTGNTSGLEALEGSRFIQATGQFSIENGVRKFNADTWDQNVELTCASGAAHRAGEQIIVTSEGEGTTEYTLVDPPADLPLDTELPNSQLISCGVVVDGQFYWRDISYFPDSSQMGGGGGGGGYFYGLNLSGTPILFPTVEPTPSGYSPEELAGFLQYTVQPGDTLEKIADSHNVAAEDIVRANDMQDTLIVVGSTLILPVTHLEAERGIVQVQIFENSEGRQRTQYLFFSENESYYQLRGDDLEPLKKVVNRPIRIWGNTSPNEAGMPILNLEKFEIIYPDLQFQILTGTQESKELNGEEVVLFTTGGITYIQMDPNGGYPGYNYFEGAEEVNIETLRVPDETYAGYPAIRVFNVGAAIDPATGDPLELQPIAGEIEVMPDPWGDREPYSSPDMIIEKLELVYYFVDPSYEEEGSEPAETQTYLQPVWRFEGHSEGGDEVTLDVQALRQEYLLPDVTEP